MLRHLLCDTDDYKSFAKTCVILKFYSFFWGFWFCCESILLKCLVVLQSNERGNWKYSFLYKLMVVPVEKITTPINTFFTHIQELIWTQPLLWVLLWWKDYPGSRFQYTGLRRCSGQSPRRLVVMEFTMVSSFVGIKVAK